MSQPDTYRRLRLERCEPRRVLSTNAFSLGDLSIDLSQTSDYLLASSSGWTPIDNDSDLRQVMSYRNADDSISDSNDLPFLSFWTNGTITAGYDGGRDLFQDTIDSIVTSRSTLDYDFSGGQVPIVVDDLLGDAVGSGLPNTTNPTVESVVEIDSADVEPTLRPEGNGGNQLSTDPPRANPSGVDGGVEPRDDGDSTDPPFRRTPLQSVARIERVTTSSPPAGAGQPGAGLIDLAQLLEADATHAEALASAAPAVVRVPDLAARDTAFAVESWVRASRATAIPQPGAVPNETLRAAETEAATQEKTAKPNVRDRQPTTAQRDQPSQSTPSEFSELAEVSVSTEMAAPGVLDRSSAYRLALAAFSTLLGGGLVWSARRQASGPDCLELPPRRSGPRSLNDLG